MAAGYMLPLLPTSRRSLLALTCGLWNGHQPPIGHSGSLSFPKSSAALDISSCPLWAAGLGTPPHHTGSFMPYDPTLDILYLPGQAGVWRLYHCSPFLLAMHL